MPIAMMLSRGYSDTSRSAGSITPADELSSWLGDDVCTVCGTGVPAGHLHCSIECRQDDAAASAAQQTKATTLTPAMAAVNGIDATPTKSAAASSAPIHSAVRKPSRGHGKSYSRSPLPGEAGNDEAGEKFRYAPPSSPSVTAKYSAALTSPALAAHDRTAAAQRSPSGLKHEASEARRNIAHGADGGASEREWQSSSESSHGASRIQESRTRTSNRRSSSRSTFSSTSEALSTDPSTPSPALRAHAEHDGDFDDFEPTVLDLPPSIVPAMLINASAQRDATIIASARNTSVKAASPPGSVQNKPSMTDAQQQAAMSYARRPSRTNMPAPVLFTSPVLATTVMKKSPPSGRSLRSPGLRSSTFAKTSPSASLHGSSLTSPSSTYVQRRQRPIAMRKMPSSPPQVASAASSAGKTLRGVSPTYEQSSQEGAGIGSGPLCGRFGCRGVSNSTDSDDETLQPDGLAHSHVDASQHARPNMLHGHKHTHSAAANLHHLGSSQYHSHRGGVLAERNVLPSVPAKATTASKLVMTPASAMQPTEGKVSTAAQSEEQLSEALRDLVSPPRGRSKARGRSSTSRRSPSPPRGVARRGISLEHGDSSKTGSIDDHAPSRSMSSERSSPISMPRQSPASDAAKTSMPVKTDRNETNEPRSRRGRSPTARGRTSVRSTSRSRAPAPQAQQRDASSKRNAGSAAIRGSIAQATAADSSPDVSHDSVSSRGDHTIRVMPRQEAEEAATSSGYDDIELDEL